MCESSDRYKGYVVRSRLRRVLNEAVKANAPAREEEMRRYIDFVKTPDGRVLRSNREMGDAFRVHFRDRFARCPDLPLQEFRSYLADFPCLGAAEAANCEGVVFECKVRDALKQVSWRFNDPSPDCSGGVQGRWSVDRSISNVRATGV